MAFSVKASADISDLKAKAAEYVNSLASMRGKTITFSEALVRANKEGVETSKVLIGLSDAQERVYVSFKKVGDSLESTKVTISKAKIAFKELQDQVEATATATRAQAAQNTGTTVRTAIPIQNTDVSKVIEYERLILKIKKSIQDGSVTAERFQEILSRLNTVGPQAAAEGLNNKELQAYQNLVRLKQAAQDLDAQKRAATSQVINKRDAELATAVGQLPVADKLSATQLSSYQNALGNIINLFREGKITIQQFNQILTDLQSNPLNALKLIDENERKLASSLSAIIRLTKDATDAEQKRQAVANKTLQNKSNAVGAATAESQLRKNVDTSNFSINQLNSFEAAIQRIKAALASGEISLKRFQELFTLIGKDPKAIIPTQNLSEAESKVLASLRGIASGFKEVQTASERFGISIQGIVRLVEALTIKRFAYGLITQFEQSVTAAKDFSIKIAEVQTISQSANISTEEWASQISKLSNKFGNSKADIAEAAYQSLSNQVTKGIDTFEFLDTALKFSKASVSSAADSVNLLSSAINSFNLPTSKAAELSASFFKTIELGRLRASDLADTYGRVGAAANAMGVGVNEVNAALATLTQSGISPSQAITYLSSLIIHLSKPTKELSDLFQELGFANARAAIDAKGLGGVLQILDEEARRNVTSTNSLLTNIRDFQATANLSGEGLKRYKDFLGEIGSASNTFNNAVKIVQESAGQEFTKQIAGLKNEFVTTFGAPTLGLINTLAKSIGGLDNAFRLSISAIKIVGTTYLVLKGSIITGNVLMATSNVTLAATWTGITASIGRATAAALAFAKANPIGAALVLGSAVGLGISAFSGKVETEINNIEELKQKAEAFDQIRSEREKERNANSLNSQRSNEEQLVNEVSNIYNKKYSVVLDYTTKVIKLSNIAKEAAVKNGKDIAEQLKLSTKTYIGELELGLNKLREDASKAKHLIQESKKQVEDIPRKLSDTLFNQKYSNASEGIEGLFPNQKLILIEARIKEILGLAREKSKENTQESIQESRKYYDEVNKLEVDRFTLIQQKRKEEFEKRVATGQETPLGIDDQGRQRFIFITQTAELEKRITALTKERLAAEQDIQSRQANIQATKLKEAEKEHDRVNELQKKIKEAAEFQSKITDEHGKVKPEFLKEPGKITKDFDDIIKRISELAGPDALKNDLRFFQDLYKQKISIAREAEIAIQTEAAKTAQILLEQNKKKNEDLLKNSKESIEKGRQQFEEATSELSKFLDSVGVGATNKAQNVGTPGLGGIFNPEAHRKFNEEQAKIKGSEDARQAALEALNKANEARNDLSTNRNIENAQKYADAIDLLNSRIKVYIGLRTGLSADKTALPGEKTVPGADPKTIGEYLEQSSKSAQKLVDSLTQQEAGKKKLSEVKEQVTTLDAVIKKIPAGFEDIKTSGERATDIVRAGFKGMENDASALIEKLNTIKQRLDELKLNQDILKNPGPQLPNAPGQMFGGVVKQYFDSGGWVGMKPRGSDNYPIMAGRDEFIVNAQSARQYGPILEAINSNKLDTGNSTVNNVGDVNVHVHGGPNDDLTVRKMAQGLRRELRRRTVTLD